MTKEEFERYRAPVFEGDEGTLVVGFWPVAKRCFLEIFLPRESKYELHGSGIVGKEWLHSAVKSGEHCLFCLCVMNHHCNLCRATENADPKVESTAASVDVPERNVARKRPIYSRVE